MEKRNDDTPNSIQCITIVNKEKLNILEPAKQNNVRRWRDPHSLRDESNDNVSDKKIKSYAIGKHQTEITFVAS